MGEIVGIVDDVEIDSARIAAIGSREGEIEMRLGVVGGIGVESVGLCLWLLGLIGGAWGDGEDRLVGDVVVIIGIDIGIDALAPAGAFGERLGFFAGVGRSVLCGGTCGAVVGIALETVLVVGNYDDILVEDGDLEAVFVFDVDSVGVDFSHFATALLVEESDTVAYVEFHGVGLNFYFVGVNLGSFFVV